MTRAEMEAMVAEYDRTPDLRRVEVSVDKWAEAVRQLLEQTRWRKVGEESPKDSEKVEFYHDGDIFSGWPLARDAHVFFGVTHWRPIQAPESEG